MCRCKISHNRKVKEMVTLKAHTMILEKMEIDTGASLGTVTTDPEVAPQVDTRVSSCPIYVRVC